MVVILLIQCQCSHPGEYWNKHPVLPPSQDYKKKTWITIKPYDSDKVTTLENMCLSQTYPWVSGNSVGDDVDHTLFQTYLASTCWNEFISVTLMLWYQRWFDPIKIFISCISIVIWLLLGYSKLTYSVNYWMTSMPYKANISYLDIPNVLWRLIFVHSTGLLLFDVKFQRFRSVDNSMSYSWGFPSLYISGGFPLGAQVRLRATSDRFLWSIHKGCLCRSPRHTHQ